MRISLIAALVLVAQPAIAVEPDSEEQLVLDFSDLMSEQYERPPASAEILEGNFGDLAAAPMRALATEQEQHPFGVFKEGDTRMSDLVLGKQPISALPPAWIPVLESSRANVKALLRATHARHGKPLYEWTELGWLYPKDWAMRGEWFFATDIAILDVWRDTAAGHADEALETCTDIFALAQETSEMLGRRALNACANAAVHAGTPELARARTSLAIVEQGWFPLEKTIRYERASEEVLFFYDTLSTETHAKIPRPHPESSDLLPHAVGWRSSLLGGFARRRAAQYFVQIERALKLPPAQGDAMIVRSDLSEGLYSLYSDGAGWVPQSSEARPGKLLYYREQKLSVRQLEAVVALAQFRTRAFNRETTRPEPTRISRSS